MYEPISWTEVWSKDVNKKNPQKLVDDKDKENKGTKKEDDDDDG